MAPGSLQARSPQYSALCGGKRKLSRRESPRQKNSTLTRTKTSPERTGSKKPTFVRVLQYQPSIYPDRLTLIASGDRAIAPSQDPTLGWGQLTEEPIKLIRIPGNHLTMLRKPQVQHLADRLRECLESR
ncbi:hypothetical protein [Oscillatoria sp. HE19RPO]|uniref:thioesterase domain-containing protein n=1 Tax=Oscillatoria sp. HE19RPO TaxID=2954806 RepID=UPI0020C53C66|nr:hypothetical protein [Oscillatoria sp. HE19RPO]